MYLNTVLAFIFTFRFVLNVFKIRALPIKTTLLQAPVIKSASNITDIYLYTNSCDCFMQDFRYCP